MLNLPVNPIYSGLCPSCGREADAYSIINYGICRKCLRQNTSYKLGLIEYNRSIENEIIEFEEYFRRATGGYSLWGSQRIWLKRLFKGENTSIIAPTGIGKTTLLITFSLYMSSRYRKKILILAPTSSLAKQIYHRLSSMAEPTGYKGRILFYDSSSRKSRRDEIIDRIRRDDYDILVITNAFLSRHPALFEKKFFDIVIADDVDSILNRSKNIVRLLNMLGYDHETIMLARELTDLRSRLLVLRANGLEDKYNEALKKYLDIEAKLREAKARNRHGQIIVASATGRARGPYIAVMRELLEFDVTGITLYARDVCDTYIAAEKNKILQWIYRIVNKVGPGGIILISSFHPLKHYISIDDIVNYLSKNTDYTVAKATPANVKKLLDGRIDIVIGSGSYYGVSVRGIDSPERIKYIIFIGTPCFSIEINNLLANIRTLYRMLIHLSENGYDVREYMIRLSRILRYINRKEYRIITSLLKERITIDDVSSTKIIEWYNTIKEIMEYTVNKLKEILDMNQKIVVGTIVLIRHASKYLGLIPDLMTYIQASGRTSRLYNGDMTHGLSIIIEDKELEDLVRALEVKMKFINKEASFKKFTRINLKRELEKIKRSRSRSGSSYNIYFKTILLVVESPTKARTIANFFGKPARRRIGQLIVYETPIVDGSKIIYLNILATRGHIFDLTTDPSRGLYGLEYNADSKEYNPIYNTIKRCRLCGHQFSHGNSCPRCGSTSIYDALEVVNVLRKLASEVDEILIGTDPDIEGEKIAFDIYLIVKPLNNHVYRVEFHEITRKELEKALREKRSININLVQAQLYRRILDRIIGFSLSTELWNKFNKHWLGAGRVQTPVLGWIIDAYRKWKEKQCIAISIMAGSEKPYLPIRICIDNNEAAKEIHEELMKEGKIFIRVIDRFEKIVKPKPPYTTDELLYDASRIGIPASLAMKLAQELFESGLITYHRTDSTYVSNTGIEIAKNYAKEKGLSEYLVPRHWGSKGTHEAIRPTHPWDATDLEKALAEGLINIPIYLTPLHTRLYDLIFRRFMSSQMREYSVLCIKAITELPRKYDVEIEIPYMIKSHGFDLVAKPVVYTWLPTTDTMELNITRIRKYRTSREKLMDHGLTIRKMKEVGIGRPSTYASILSKIRRHGYIIESKKRKYLIPTKTGIDVYNYLIDNYPDLVSIETTRYMEKLIDMITVGAVDAVEAIEDILSRLVSHKLIHHEWYIARELVKASS